MKKLERPVKLPYKEQNRERRTGLSMEISLAGFLEEGKGFEDLEREVFEGLCRSAREAIVRFLEALDLALSQGREAALRLVGKRPRTLVTRFGDVVFKRRLYREKGTGRYRFLLDEALGLPVREAVSKTVATLALSLAAVLPFRRAVEVLGRFLPQAFSATALQRLVWRFGGRVEEAEAKGQEAVFEDGEVPPLGEEAIRRLFVEGDGVSVALQREEEGRAEVKVSVGYTGWEPVGQGRYRVVGKVAHAGLEDTQTFWERFWLRACKRYDVSRLEYVVVGGDGAGWIAEGGLGLPGAFQLDRFHLWRALRQALGGEEALAWEVYLEATKGQWERVEGLLGRVLSRPDLPLERLEAVREVYRYLANNREGLGDWRDRLPSQPGDRSLGTIEGNGDKLIAIRTKRRGMSWRKRGLHSMAKLLQCGHEGEVEAYASPIRRRPTPGLPQQVASEGRKVKAKGQASTLVATLPALRGPHASRPWVRILKALSIPPLN